MRAYVLTVIEIAGEKSEEYVTNGKFALLNRAKASVADSAFAVARIVSPDGLGQIVWTDDAPEDQLSDWQAQLMKEIAEDNDG